MRKFFIPFIIALTLAGSSFSVHAQSNTENLSTEVKPWSFYIAPRSTYKTSFSFENVLRTNPRYYDGSDLCFLSRDTQTNAGDAVGGAEMEVSLFRGKHGDWFNKVGTKTVPMRGNWKIMWTNIGPWNYYFTITKKNWAHPNVTVFSSDVILTNECGFYY